MSSSSLWLLAALCVCLFVLLFAVESSEAATGKSSFFGKPIPPIKITCTMEDLRVPVTKDQCGPLFTRPKDVCDLFVRRCKCQHNIELKWTGRGCPRTNKGKKGKLLPGGDGGCQCANYCGWKCKSRCVGDVLKRCEWVGGRCRNKYTWRTGPVITCYDSPAPTKSPTTLPSKAPTTSVPSKAPTNLPSKAPTDRPSQSPTGSGPTSSPSKTPSKAPSKAPSSSPSKAPSSSPSEVPSSSPTKVPSTSPSSSPSTSPSTAPSSSPTKAPSSSPSKVPSSSPTKVPSTSPSSSPSTAPSSSPTELGGPTASPTCFRPGFVDIVWVLDGSTSMEPIPPDDYGFPGEDNFADLRNFVTNFTSTITMSPTATRQVYLEFAGAMFNLDDTYVGFQTVGPHLNLSDPASTDAAAFSNSVNGLTVIRGNTDMAGAFDYIRTAMFTPSNRRPGSHRLVILGADGRPSDKYGQENAAANTAAETAMAQLKQEDGVIFVFLRIGTDYPPGFFDGIADYVYDTTFPTLNNLLDEGFLCIDLTFQPTTSPTTSLPSTSPSVSPSTSPTPPTTFGPSTSPTTSSPSTSPTTSSPSTSPSSAPSTSPTTSSPSATPTTSRPSTSPSTAPTTGAPSSSPSKAPTVPAPSTSPSSGPSASPTTPQPSASPSNAPSAAPSASPSSAPSAAPTVSAPSASPSTTPSGNPTVSSPTGSPTPPTTFGPSTSPTTSAPSTSPTTSSPSTSPSSSPSVSPSTSSPSTSPTTSRPSTGPSASPSSSPTTSSPSASPSTSSPTVSPTNPTEQPSTSPSLSPSTSRPSTSPSATPSDGPSRSPSKAPTFAPTSSPTNCVPGIVTCCFSVYTNITAFYVDGIDYTSSIVPQSGLNSPGTMKSISFPAPFTTSVIAIKGFKRLAEGDVPGLFMQCSNPRPSGPSNWTFTTTASTWRTLMSSDPAQDVFPSDWNALSLANNLTRQAQQNNDPAFILGTSGDCPGPFSPTNRIRPNIITSDYFVFRRVVLQEPPCGSFAPTASPTICQDTSTFSPAAFGDTHQCEVATRCGPGCGCVDGQCVLQQVTRCDVGAVDRLFCCPPGDTLCLSTLENSGLNYTATGCPSGSVCARDCCSEVEALACQPICETP